LEYGDWKRQERIARETTAFVAARHEELEREGASIKRVGTS
jgi:hypothetical protein